MLATATSFTSIKLLHGKTNHSSLHERFRFHEKLDIHWAHLRPASFELDVLTARRMSSW